MLATFYRVPHLTLVVTGLELPSNILETPNIKLTPGSTETIFIFTPAPSSIFHLHLQSNTFPGLC